MKISGWTSVAMAVLAMCLCCILSHADDGKEPKLVTLVELDWAYQESQNNRTMSDPEAIADLYQRFRLLADDLGLTVPETDVARLDSLSDTQRSALYRTLRWQLRDMAFQNPLL